MFTKSLLSVILLSAFCFSSCMHMHRGHGGCCAKSKCCSSKCDDKKEACDTEAPETKSDAKKEDKK